MDPRDHPGPRGAPGDELVAWVDEDGAEIEIVTRSRMRAENLRHRSVGIAVVSSGRRLLVHRRSDDKDVWPGMWDVCAGGVVGAGESYDEAAARELAEELGISGVVPEPIGHGRYEDHEVRTLARVYRVVHDGPYRFADGEVAEARLVTSPELRELLVRERFVPDGVALALPLLGEFAPLPDG